MTPRHPLEVAVASLWRDMLGRQPSTEEAFWGDDVALLDRIEHEYGVRLAADTFRQAPTVAHLASLVKRAQDYSQPLVEIQPGRGRVPIVFLHGDFRGGGLFCRSLAGRIGSEWPFHAIHPHGLDGAPVPDSIECMALDRMREVLQRHPRGPLVLGAIAMAAWWPTRLPVVCSSRDGTFGGYLSSTA